MLQEISRNKPGNLLTSKTLRRRSDVWLCLPAMTDAQIPSSVFGVEDSIPRFVENQIVFEGLGSARHATHADVSLRNIVMTFGFCGNVRTEKVTSELPSVMSGLHARFCYSNAFISFLCWRIWRRSWRFLGDDEAFAHRRQRDFPPYKLKLGVWVKGSKVTWWVVWRLSKQDCRELAKANWEKKKKHNFSR